MLFGLVLLPTGLTLLFCVTEVAAGKALLLLCPSAPASSALGTAVRVMGFALSVCVHALQD